MSATKETAQLSLLIAIKDYLKDGRSKEELQQLGFKLEMIEAACKLDTSALEAIEANEEQEEAQWVNLEGSSASSSEVDPKELFEMVASIGLEQQLNAALSQLQISAVLTKPSLASDSLTSSPQLVGTEKELSETAEFVMLDPTTVEGEQVGLLFSGGAGGVQAEVHQEAVEIESGSKQSPRSGLSRSSSFGAID